MRGRRTFWSPVHWRRVAAARGCDRSIRRMPCSYAVILTVGLVPGQVVGDQVPGLFAAREDQLIGREPGIVPREDANGNDPEPRSTRTLGVNCAPALGAEVSREGRVGIR